MNLIPYNPVTSPYELIIGLLSIFPLVFLRGKDTFIYFEIAALVAIGIHGVYLFGTPILYLLLLTYIVSTIAEVVSLKTSIRCFGVAYRYHHNSMYFPSKIWLFGVYPIEVTFAWVIFKYLSFCLAMLILEAFRIPHIVGVFLTPLILVSVDLILDPVSVNINNMWEWGKKGRYFGIPVQNFIGWYMVGLVPSLLWYVFPSTKEVSFSVLYLLPIIFYGFFSTKSLLLYRLNKPMAILGSLPVIVWTLLGTVSLGMLLFR